MSTDPESAAPSPKDEIRRDLVLIRALRRISQALDVHSRRMSSRSQVTLPQLLCLMAVVAEEGLTARQVAQYIFVSPSTLVGMIDRLQAKGLIERSRDENDRRKIHILPTPAGTRLVEELPSPVGARFERAFGMLSTRRQKELVRSFTVIAEMIEEGGDEPGSGLSVRRV